MDWKKLACMLAIASFTFVGCGDDDGTGDGDGDTTMVDMGAPEPLPDELRPIQPEEYIRSIFTNVISVIRTKKFTR